MFSNRYEMYAYMRKRKAHKHRHFVFCYNECMANKEYAEIINKARSRGLKKPKKNSENYQYYELHHIVPKSCGGYDYNYNLVLLTRYEHIKCHEILATMGYAEYAFLHMIGKYQVVL